MDLSLSALGTLLVPVERERLDLPAELCLGARRLVRKAEHHVTVVGFALGRRLRAAFAEDAELEPRLVAAARAIDWTLALTPELFHLVEADVETIVVLVRMPGLAAFYAAAGAIVPPSLAPAFAGAPPAHITLFTSDPAGARGIGLGRAGDLEAACARAALGEAASAEGGRALLAYRLHPGVLPLADGAQATGGAGPVGGAAPAASGA